MRQYENFDNNFNNSMILINYVFELIRYGKKAEKNYENGIKSLNTWICAYKNDEKYKLLHDILVSFKKSEVIE
jgi:hypothetical protein